MLSTEGVITTFYGEDDDKVLAVARVWRRGREEVSFELGMVVSHVVDKLLGGKKGVWGHIC